MTTRSFWTAGMAILGLTWAAASGAAEYPARSLKAISAPLQAHLALGKADITTDSLTLTAFKGSDFYSGGATPNLTAPTVLFPVAGDFIFSARVTVAFQNTFDGGALMLYADDRHWVKFLVERSQPGLEGVTSTVVDDKGDDAYHVFLKPDETSAYLKITRQGDFFVLYTSLDGKAWTIARDFTIDASLPLQAGFEAQSPLGEAFTAQFDHIRFDTKAPSDYWTGE